MPTIYIENKNKLPKRKKLDFYPTPVELCKAVVNSLPNKESFSPFYILDPGAGTGVWGEAIRARYLNSILYGVEIRDTDRPTGTREYSWWYGEQDYLEWKPDLKFDLIIGNPPYYIGQEFVEKSFELLNEDGYLVFLLKLSLLESIKRYKNFWPIYKPKKVLVLAKRPSFTGDKKTDASAYMICTWQKGYMEDTVLDWLNWKYDE